LVIFRDIDFCMPDPWKLILTEDFSSDSALKDWKFEGAGKAQVVTEGGLHILTDTRDIYGISLTASILWYKEKLSGDLRFEFDIKSDGTDHSIFLFNAQPLKGHQSIFEWDRECSRNCVTAGDDRIQMYSLGLLARAGQPDIRFRFIGGPIYTAFPNYFNEKTLKIELREGTTIELFNEKSTLKSVPNPYSEVGRTYHVDIHMVDNHLKNYVDGKLVMEADDHYHEKAFMKGGWFGFRNFTPGNVWINRLRVYQKST
jgi:hypothetical protein